MLAALSIALSAQTRSDLAQRIDTLISQGPTAHGLWGIEITDLESGEVLYEYDSARLFMPASNQKLITTAAALALIGPQWTFHTTVESTAPIGHNGRLAGDLVLVGRGDPNISGRALPYHPNGQRIATEVILQGLADQLVAHGLKLVQGDVVGDDSYLVWQPFSTGWAWDDLMWDSGAPVSALSVNDNLISVTLKPGPKAGDPVEIVLAPDLAYYKIDNRAVTAAAHSGPRRVGMHRDPGSRTLIIWGTVPLGDAGATLNLTIQDPAEYAARLLRELLKERGVQVLGGVKVRHTEMMTLPLPKPGEKPQPTPPKPMAEPAAPAPGTHVLAEHISRPLVDDLKVTDKVSQNLHAELLLRLLGGCAERLPLSQAASTWSAGGWSRRECRRRSSPSMTAAGSRGWTWFRRTPWSRCCATRRRSLGGRSSGTCCPRAEWMARCRTGSSLRRWRGGCRPRRAHLST